MMFLAKLGVGVLGTALVGGAALSSEGFIHVKVKEKAPGGTHINLLVPAAAVPMALSLVPRAIFAMLRRNYANTCRSLMRRSRPCTSVLTAYWWKCAMPLIMF
jgi:hypothetical protein